MFKRPHYIAIGLAGLLTLVVLNLPNHTANQIKLAIGSLFLPLFGLAKTSHQVADKAGDLILPRSELIRQNDELRQTNQQLQIRSLQADALMKENDRLRQQIGWQTGWQKQKPWKLKPASVLLRDPANWWQTIEIDLGSRDGMKPDMAVMTTNGLIGKIISVRLASSQVALVGNPNCKVAVMIEKTRETGVISGAASPLDHTLLRLTFLSSNSSLKPGQSVVTSGIGGIFPKDLPVGQVAEDSRPVEFGLYTEARVKLGANLNTLEQVWVLTP
ncbi:MAG: Cell shape-determining protein MreC [Pedosphaera sp.]|nr:Cell shape-determining protein MreC [Pedosphaera sp.]